MPHPVIANLREYTRLHLFFAQFLASCANQIKGTQFICHPEFEGYFSKPMLATELALMKEELVVPQNITDCPMEKLIQVIHKASRGRLGETLAVVLKESAHTTFAIPHATEALSFSMKAVAEIYEQVKPVTLPRSKNQGVSFKSPVFAPA